MRPPGRQTRRISCATLTGIRDHADEVWRVDDIERVVGEPEVGGVHLQQTRPLALRGALAGLLEHRRGVVDAGNHGAPRVQGEVDARADANLQDAVTRLDAHPFMAWIRPGCSVGPNVRS